MQGQECFSCPCLLYRILNRNNKSEHIAHLENVFGLSLFGPGDRIRAAGATPLHLKLNISYQGLFFVLSA